ncbi:methyltransferase type 12 [Nocardioides gansuensis]|uniref:Methyltransferase type 12 n=1 Tax=Nocardioides gansuensis TaxID=2138300 RepID=A0A2T8F8N2_9ACTN|nr:DinB family protein [Nocardioides gansuensis]PVG82055.1 methyltransferase type 12 [Nocardioides gansuensis]
MPSLETTGDPIPPDTKDWTWVLERPCPECGFDAAAVGVADVPGLVHDTSMALADALLRADATTRPDATTWSAVEYACHVRDVHRIFGERLALMLAEDEPRFANWDQDETAVAERYAEQDPAVVAAELVEEAGATAGLFAGVTPDQHARRGVRSNGSEFTVETLGRYYVHDLVHHVHDVGARP